ncbi:Polygalacturonase [Nesidiocoris tenuis]|uniref:endo-polygalacturonase n=1 Tax=Nesidiocoris tenuis TaxID=355587 RepID=A0ABN7AF36_9HEMI|nr:Polygalacturonase [Nesidiocoris tenuis]
MERLVFALGLCLAIIQTIIANPVEVNNINQLQNAKKSKHIILKNVVVPAGVSLDLTGLQPGTVVEFDGVTKFGYKEWKGPLIKTQGSGITIRGRNGHLIDCEGRRWWDGKGGNGGKTKPQFFHIVLTDSKIEHLNVKNIPVHGFAINGKNIYIAYVRIDNLDGRTQGGHNTDGFDVANAENIRITNCYVDNQDDCLALNSGKNILFEYNICKGGHGISIAPWGRSFDEVRDVRVIGCQVLDSRVGIRVKTGADARGIVKNVTYDNIVLQNIRVSGIIVHGNYRNTGQMGKPTAGVPIEDLTINNVRGNVLKDGTNIQIYVADGMARNWKWSQINVNGGTRKVECGGKPNNVHVQCG